MGLTLDSLDTSPRYRLLEIVIVPVQSRSLSLDPARCRSTGFARQREPFYLLLLFVSASFTKSRTLSIQSFG